jgi:hypothetical protein
VVEVLRLKSGKLFLLQVTCSGERGLPERRHHSSASSPRDTLRPSLIAITLAGSEMIKKRIILSFIIIQSGKERQNEKKKQGRKGIY